MNHRIFTHAELQALYCNHNVTDYGDTVIIKSGRKSGGPTLLELPKKLPVDSNGSPIDLTSSIFDHDNDVCRIFRTNFDGEIFIRLGHLTLVNCRNPTTSGTAISRLNPSDPSTANAIQLIVYRHQAPAFCKPLPPDISPELQPLIVSRDTIDIDDRTFIDFWLIKIPENPTPELLEFRSHYTELWNERLESLS